jgi:5-methylcytosine-specific restriction enzyme B
MTQADQIREYVIKTYIQLPRSQGQSSVRIRSGNIARELHLQNRMPNVCTSLGGDIFLAQARVTLISRSGPAQGATVE